jgi:hypothetical protein
MHQTEKHVPVQTGMGGAFRIDPMRKRRAIAADIIPAKCTPFRLFGPERRLTHP